MNTPAPLKQEDWYDNRVGNPDDYQDGFCDDHGDCAAIYRNNAWRCTICGVPVETSPAQPPAFVQQS